MQSQFDFFRLLFCYHIRNVALHYLLLISIYST